MLYKLTFVSKLIETAIEQRIPWLFAVDHPAADATHESSLGNNVLVPLVETNR